METIENAEKSIDIRTFIFDNDDFAVAMADELKERAEDVRVRVMGPSRWTSMPSRKRSTG